MAKLAKVMGYPLGQKKFLAKLSFGQDFFPFLGNPLLSPFFGQGVVLLPRNRTQDFEAQKKAPPVHFPLIRHSKMDRSQCFEKVGPDWGIFFGTPGEGEFGPKMQNVSKKAGPDWVIFFWKPKRGKTYDQKWQS